MKNEMEMKIKKKKKTHSLICLTEPNFPKISYISSLVILKGRFLNRYCSLIFEYK